jgi:hypothetical protein
MIKETRRKRFDPVLRGQLMESFKRLEQLKVLPERDLRTIYSSQRIGATFRPVPNPTVRQLNARFSNS